MTDVMSPERCVYGPVPSRRLGRSLGVDVVPLKTCTYDCVYCQLGATTSKTTRRWRWLSPGDVVARVRARLESEPDVITLAGSGEPTLYEGLGEVIAGIKELTTIPLAVITNGSLLGLPAVQHDLAAADIVLPSLDAPDEPMYTLINRPHEDLNFAEVIHGMVQFREGYRGQIWLEVMLLDGPTETAASGERLATLAARLAPDRIQLNTVVRPPAESTARPVPPEQLRELAAVFTPHAEVVAVSSPAAAGASAGHAQVLALLGRRPCTVADIAAGLGIHHGEALKIAMALVDAGLTTKREHGGHVYYVTTSPNPDTLEMP